MARGRGVGRALLGCSLSDKLCVIREQQYEIIVVPALLVGAFLILVGVILWLFIRGQRARRQGPGPQEPPDRGHGLVSSLLLGTAPAPPPMGRSWEAAGPGGNVSAPLKGTSVASLLEASTRTLAELQLPREQLSAELEQIHSGSFGGIYRTTMHTGDRAEPQSVVLKTLKEPAGLPEVRDFLGQLHFRRLLGAHENVVRLRGCCTDRLPLLMVLEDVAPGDLLRFLWTCRRVSGARIPPARHGETPWVSARGGEFLQDKHLFHGDVAARNVLIRCDLTAKLCGLGLAYEVHARGAIPPTHTVPLKWLAPERLLMRPAGIKADIWSFGILLYEMVTLASSLPSSLLDHQSSYTPLAVFPGLAPLQAPAPGEDTSAGHSACSRGPIFSSPHPPGAPPYPDVPPASILQHLQRKKTMKRPSSCTHGMYALMRSCWRWAEDGRPSLTELRGRLDGAARAANDRAVLQVPEPVVPEEYAAVAGVGLDGLSYSCSVL
ncbi:Tyrosine-protein kinase STYK1 [Galemys pyrenaicus]|uniref:Tyrosine-protein kinase STYK1 n=1 Tax=Galemys pyrenaicus TaxID=202257 RepID=A0A8J6DN02_GALPY|nr:Tyrosine-protein kinase STYK1 [Galemys pyrenaicus]